VGYRVARLLIAGGRSRRSTHRTWCFSCCAPPHGTPRLLTAEASPDKRNLWLCNRQTQLHELVNSKSCPRSRVDPTGCRG
jgi:hypothetical protein